MKFFSPSRLSTYETCPLQYRFRYLDRLAAREQTVEAFLGKRVHEVLERLYKDVAHARIASMEDLTALYEKTWEDKWDENIRIVRKEYAQEDYLKMGRRYLTLFYKRHHPFDSSRTLALEEKLFFPIDGEGKFGITGVADRLSMAADGTLQIHDYKTSASLPSQESLDRDRQLGLYQMGVMERWPGFEKIILVWHYLAHDLEMKSQRNIDQLKLLRDETVELIREIISRTTFPPRENNLCPWCLYRSDCPLFAHEASVATLDREQFFSDDGVILADKFMKLRNEEKALREESEKVEEDIFRYAEQHGLDALVGRNCRLKIVKTTEVSYPLKGDPARKELEALLKEAGVWKQVSSLDGHALTRKVKEAVWSDELIEKVRGFEIVREKKYIRKTDRQT